MTKNVLLASGLVLLTILCLWIKYRVDGTMVRHHMGDSPPALSEDEFKQMQDYLREQKRLREKNRPAAQGDYQWEGGYVFHPAFGEYVPLYYQGKKVGGMFGPDTRWPNEYHKFSEDGGVSSLKSEPPVPFTK
ncbi:MAG TPA: hypothetical protein PLN21_09395 [Gemmatales bacterium]|nr:hypothetical protein [Gemmatales bacterium]